MGWDKALLLLFLSILSFGDCFTVFVYDLPQIKQQKEYYCGVAALDGALRKQGVYIPGGQFALAQILKTDYFFLTPPDAIVNYVNSIGLHAKYECFATPQDLSRYLKNGESVIMPWNWDGVPHYSGLSGVDPYFIYLNDPWYDVPIRYYWSYFYRGWYPTNFFTHCPGPALRISLQKL